MNEPLLAAQRNRMSIYNSASDSVRLLHTIQDTAKMAATPTREDDLQRQLTTSQEQADSHSTDDESLRRRTASSPASASDTDDFISIEVRERKNIWKDG